MFLSNRSTLKSLLPVSVSKSTVVVISRQYCKRFQKIWRRWLSEFFQNTYLSKASRAHCKTGSDRYRRIRFFCILIVKSISSVLTKCSIGAMVWIGKTTSACYTWVSLHEITGKIHVSFDRLKLFYALWKIDLIPSHTVALIKPILLQPRSLNQYPFLLLFQTSAVLASFKVSDSFRRIFHLDDNYTRGLVDSFQSQRFERVRAPVLKGTWSMKSSWCEDFYHCR